MSSAGKTSWFSREKTSRGTAGAQKDGRRAERTLEHGRLDIKKKSNTTFTFILQPKCKLGGFLSDEPKELIRSRFLGTQKTS